MRDYLRPFLPMFGSLLIPCSLFAQLAPVSTGRMTYPLEAKAAGREGSVKLQAVIDETGQIGALRVISGPQEFQEAALQAVRQWRYRPYLKGGVPTKVHTIITVNFKLGDKAQKAKAMAEAHAALATGASAPAAQPASPTYAQPQ